MPLIILEEILLLTMSEVSKRVWRTEGGWREEILHLPEIQVPFLYPFSYAPLGEGGHISGELFGFFFGVCLSPTPSLRQPLFETSDNEGFFLHAAGACLLPIRLVSTLLTVGRCV